MPLTLLKISLISFALTVIWTQLSGPFGIVEATKDLIVKASGGLEWVENGINCLYCSGFWITLIVAMIFQTPPLWLPSLGLTYFMFVIVSMYLTINEYAKDYNQYVKDQSDYVDAMTGRNMQVETIQAD